MNWKKIVEHISGKTPHSDNKSIGHKIAIIGFFLTIIGWGFSLFSFHVELVRWIIYVGMGVILVGVITVYATDFDGWDDKH